MIIIKCSEQIEAFIMRFKDDHDNNLKCCKFFKIIFVIKELWILRGKEFNNRSEIYRSLLRNFIH